MNNTSLNQRLLKVNTQILKNQTALRLSLQTYATKQDLADLHGKSEQWVYMIVKEYKHRLDGLTIDDENGNTKEIHIELFNQAYLLSLQEKMFSTVKGVA